MFKNDDKLLIMIQARTKSDNSQLKYEQEKERINMRHPALVKITKKLYEDYATESIEIRLISNILKIIKPRTA